MGSIPVTIALSTDVPDENTEHDIRLIEVTNGETETDYYYTMDELSGEEQEIVNDLQKNEEVVSVDPTNPPESFSSEGNVTVTLENNQLLVFSVSVTTPDDVRYELLDKIAALTIGTLFIGGLTLVMAHERMVNYNWIVYKESSSIPRIRL